jgi:putative ABC transport system permease protein
MIKNYLKIALRNLQRNKIYSFINISGLAIGLAAAMLIMLYTKDEVSYDLFHANNPNIYRIVNKWVNPDGTLKQQDGNTGNMQGPKFKDNIPEIQTFVRVRGDFKDVRKDNEINGYEMISTDANFFSVFSFPFLSGNPTTSLNNPKSIVISEDMARKFFGSTQVVGKTLELKDNDKFEPYLITGVTKKCPQNSSLKFDFIVPLIVSREEYQNTENWFNFFQNTFVVLTPGADANKVEAKMKQVYEADAKEAMKKMLTEYGVKETAVYLLQPFTEMHLSTAYNANNGLKDASNPMYSYILTGIAVFILIIACINFINLTLARSLKRAKEIGVRKVVGGDRKQLVWQFLGESFVLSFVAFVLAIGLVILVLPVFNQLANKSLSFSYLTDTSLIVSYIGIFILTGVLAGFYPALVLSSYNPVQTLYGRFKLKGKNYLQKSLVVLQFGLASFLIIAAITIYAQFNYMINKELGYDDKNIIMIHSWNMAKNQASLFKEELSKNPNVLAVAPKNGGNWGTVAKINGETQIDFTYETVDETYIPMLKVPMLKGRNFSKDFPSDSTHSIIVNEAFVKKAGWKEPLGQTVNFWYRNDEKYTVIGVIKDYHYAPLREEIKPQLFTIKPSNRFGMFNIKIKPNTETAVLPYIAKIYKKIFPVNAYTYKFKELENIKNYEAEAKWKQIILFGAILTIFISSIGLFGLTTLSIERRTKEIGIRKVFGASVSQIVKLISQDFLKLVLIAFVIAIPLAWYATNQWLQNFAYRIDISWWIFALSGVLSASIALFTTSFQAIKAALANPVKSLRTE